MIDTRLGGSITARTASHERTLGYDAATFTIDYGASSPQTETFLYALHQRPTSGALFVDDLWRPSSSWLLETGLRGEAYTGAGFSWLGVSPRVSAKYFVTPEFAVTAAVGKFTQGIALAGARGHSRSPVRLLGGERFGDACVERVALRDRRREVVRDVAVRAGGGILQAVFAAARRQSVARSGRPADELLLGRRGIVRSGRAPATVRARAVQRMDRVHVRRRDAPARFASLLPGARPAARLQLRRELAGEEVSDRRCGSATRRERRTPTSWARSCGASTIRDSTRSARAAAVPRTSSSAARATARGLPATQRLDLERDANVFGARHDDRAVSERRERVLREERVHVRVRLFREPADERGDLAVPAAAVGRCLDSLLGVAPVALAAARRRRLRAGDGLSPADDAERRRARGDEPKRGRSGRVPRAHAHRSRPRVGSQGLRPQRSDRERRRNSDLRRARGDQRLERHGDGGSRGSTVQPNGEGRGVYVVPMPASAIRLGAALQAPRAHARRARTSRRLRGFRCPRCRRPAGSRERSIATTTR